MLFDVAMFLIFISLCLFEAVSVDDYFSSKFSTRSSLVINAVIDIFILSYHGEKIIDESLKIRERIYNSNWYYLCFSSGNRENLKNFSCIINLSMMRASRFIHISAGGFSVVGYQTFMSVSFPK